MGTYTRNRKLYKADPIDDARRTFNITKMLNNNWDILDAPGTFEELEASTGTYSTQTLESSGGLDTWTTIITDNNTGQELARRVEKESKTPEGRAKWTTTTTIDGQKTTIVDEETATGWKRTVV